MNFGLPKNKIDEILDKLNELFMSSASPLSSKSWDFKLLKKNCESLKANDAYLGYMYEAMLYALCDDEHLFKETANKAKLIAAGFQENWNFLYAQGLSHIGRYSEAQDIFSELSNPENGSFGLYNGLGYHIGSFQKLSSSFKRAAEMRLKYNTDYDVDLTDCLSKIMEENDTSDKDVAKLMEVAHQVASKNGFAVKGVQASFIEDDETLRGYAWIKMMVSAEPRDIIRMSSQLADEVAVNIENIPEVLHVSYTIENKNNVSQV